MKRFAYLSVLVMATVASQAYAQFQLTAAQQAWVDQTLSRMTLDEKIGAVLCPVTDTGFINVDSDDFQAIKDNIQKYHVGCYHVEGSGGNPISAALLISRMQALAKVPLLITADLEGGAGYQFEGATRFPRGMAIGATGNTRYAYDAASATAKEAKAMGIDVNFYPVVDVNNNPQNPIINIRSFGERPESVGDFGAAYVKGAQGAGVIATAKHFPGHGDTSVDSHLELPVVNFDRARLNLIELPPFEAAIKAGADAVMTAHIAEPQMENDTPNVPASLSASLTTGLLRHDLGFKGLIFTDALVMHAISTNFGAEQAPVMAVKAGADVALEPEDIPKSFAAMKDAVSKGEITEARLDESVRRLLAAKAWEGLNAHAAPDLAQVDALVGGRDAGVKSDEIMEHAVTLVKDDKRALPLKIDPNEDVLLVNIMDSGDVEYHDTPGLTFREEFEKRHPKALYVAVPPTISRNEIGLITQLAERYRTIVVSCSIRIASYKGSVGLNDVQRNLVKELAQHNGPFVFALFGSPYLLDYLPELPSYVLAYEYYPGAERAVVRALFGEIPFQGKLPVTVGTFPVGFSLKKPPPE